MDGKLCKQGLYKQDLDVGDGNGKDSGEREQREQRPGGGGSKGNGTEGQKPRESKGVARRFGSVLQAPAATAPCRVLGAELSKTQSLPSGSSWHDGGAWYRDRIVIWCGQQAGKR